MVETVGFSGHRKTALLTATRPSPAILAATAADEGPIFAVLTLSFAVDPTVRWLYPDPQQYLTCWPEFIRAFGGCAFDHGTAYHTEGYTGAALWMPPGIRPDEAALVALLERSVPGHRQAEVFGVLEQMDAYHPSEPHWYLPIIGVDPVWQGRGLGAALLQHTLARCDREQVPAYLESSNPRNISLYERHGFAVVGTIQVGTAPPLHPMVRAPGQCHEGGRGLLRPQVST